MKTAVIYARYSSDNQTEQSIEGQLRVCQKYAENNNILILNKNNNDYYREYIVKLGELKLRNTSYTEKLMKKCFEW